MLGPCFLTTEIRHRVSHINAAAKGKSAAELRDKAAIGEIEDLWAEVRQAASSAVKRLRRAPGRARMADDDEDWALFPTNSPAFQDQAAVDQRLKR